MYFFVFFTMMVIHIVFPENCVITIHEKPH